ncbi:pyridoxamine 5'-phosphate oxidase [Motilibacter peucedani]|uniref:Pyridoxine/pyridoxamine 5'-phosphate oxidase n=2 Tax=Motilibacter peucedani TaxID=598650 RepID=A0A420XKE3_9ACTN|nr:pyridoxamine 5'-phosphate oxidase [Motilibacter peucedani]RKS68549.1 pyridoxamine 5'-phosphate oxidase [Motilibacter peucedani]
MSLDPASMRRSYERAALDAADLAATPAEQFARWLADAVAAGVTEPNAMTLATADAQGRPSARTVLLKHVDELGFALYTNLLSRKGRELAANPYASLVFPWLALERQVVVVGRAELVAREEVAAYFASRPHGSQVGAWASHQSQVVDSRATLEQRYAELAARWPDEVPVPEHWGGWRVVPDTVEFWQGRPSRLHDRLRYRRGSDGGWRVERLEP